MAEPNLISPMLDNCLIGDAISEHTGVCSYPVMRQDTEEKYILKIITEPSSPSKLDALLLSGAYPDEADALAYYRSLAESVLDEVSILDQLSQLEGFLSFESSQLVETDDPKGYAIYLLSPYMRTLERHMSTASMTHLAAANLGLDLCAALTVARRAGYLFVDLRPDNIYITAEGEYKIGDLGFLRMDALKYASLPERCRTAYTAPEAQDAYTELNTTLDVYALGLVLYEVYNGQQLPVLPENSAEFPAPQYADYEMAEIILKACAQNPEDRWQSPVDMGQAIVSYMQRNGIHDTPIIPPVVPAEEPAPQEVPEEIPEESLSEETAEQIPGEEAATEESAAAPDVTESPIEYIEDDFGNLAFLDDVFADESDLSQEDLDYSQMSEEVTEMLEQADALATHEVPDPVVAPEPIEVPIPDPIVIPEAPENLDATRAVTVDTGETPVLPDDGQEAEPTEQEPEDAPKKSHWIRNSIIILSILAVLAVATIVFLRYYLLPIHGIRLEGSEDRLTVYVDSDIQDSLLEVVCTDSHGNPFSAPVVNGKAVFEGLVPDTGYNIKVVVKGFHKLTGDSSTAYSTPVQTNIVQFSAITGSTGGSMIIGFTVDGPESSQWTLRYWAEDEAELSVTFPSRMVTLDGLTIGKEYIFRLEPVDDLYITGQLEFKAVASDLVYAQDLAVTQFADNTLSASWTAPQGIEIESWTIRCYNSNGYDQTRVVDGTTVTFDDVDVNSDYTLEVIAAGMSVSQRTYIKANSINITDITVTPQSNGSLMIQWNSSIAVPEGGWLLNYTVEGLETSDAVYCSENTTVLPYFVPDARYVFTIQTTSSRGIVGTPFIYETPETDTFSRTYGNYTTNAEDIEFSMCITPSFSNWNRTHLTESSYTTIFTSGQKASFLMRMKKSYGVSSERIYVTYVIRNTEGNPVSISTTSSTWTNLWSRNYGELHIPTIPAEAGNYMVSIYFNSQYVTTQSFIVQ